MMCTIGVLYLSFLGFYISLLFLWYLQVLFSSYWPLSAGMSSLCGPAFINTIKHNFFTRFPRPALIYGCSHSRLHVNLCVESFELCDELVLITQLTPQLCPQPLWEHHWSERNDFTSPWSQQFKTPACPRTRAPPRTSHNYPGGDKNAERTRNLAAEIHRTLNPAYYQLHCGGSLMEDLFVDAN